MLINVHNIRKTFAALHQGTLHKNLLRTNIACVQSCGSFGHTVCGGRDFYLLDMLDQNFASLHTRANVILEVELSLSPDSGPTFKRLKRV